MGKDVLGIHEDYIKLMVEHLLPESKDLDTLLSSIEKIKNYCFPDQIESCARKVKHKYDNNPKAVKKFVSKNMLRIVKFPRLIPLFLAEMQLYILEQIGAHEKTDQ